MKAITTIIALALAVAFAAPALAGGGGTPTTKADCEKAGGKWDDQKGGCATKEQK
jgi:hypothetical protein